MVVTNSSPLIYLAALSDFELLPRLFGDISMPPAVWREVVEQGSAFPVHDAVRAATGKWLRVVPLEVAVQPISIRDHLLHLGETISCVLSDSTSPKAITRRFLERRAKVRHNRGRQRELVK